MAKARFKYLTCCVDSTAEAIDDMTDQAREITFRTFASRTEWRPLAERLGYDGRRLTLGNDPFVRFYRSRYKGLPCYYLVWSAIEYVFVGGAIVDEFSRFCGENHE